MAARDGRENVATSEQGALSSSSRVGLELLDGSTMIRTSRVGTACTPRAAISGRSPATPNAPSHATAAERTASTPERDYLITKTAERRDPLR